MGDWKLLDDSYKNIQEAHKVYKSFDRTDTETVKEQTSGSLPFGYPQVQPIFMSMMVLRNWMKHAKVQVHYKGLEKLKKVPGYRNVITPNHPNLFDSLVLRYLFYITEQVVPFTAAIDVLAGIPLVGKLLKDNGVFFINTKKFGDLKYRNQVNSFMQAITDQTEWLSFYAEGDRGAQERQRVLRHGLIKAMVDKPCAFFPVSVSYEKIPHSYLTEIGNIYIEVHDPILHTPLDNFDQLISRIGEDMQRGVNAYTTDLTATILLNYPPNSTVTISELERDVDWLRAVLVSREVPYIEVPMTTVLQHLNIKPRQDKVTVPLDPKWLLAHRERILHTLYDLADPPAFLSKEFAWTPPDSLILDDKISNLSSKAISPLVGMYASIITLLDQGVNKVNDIEKAIVSRQITLETVRNTLRILQTQKIITVQDDLIILN
jgi:1-acyl-sn-glycerol-3-phosphate acyltransferase